MRESSCANEHSNACNGTVYIRGTSSNDVLQGAPKHKRNVLDLYVN